MRNVSINYFNALIVRDEIIADRRIVRQIRTIDLVLAIPIDRG